MSQTNTAMQATGGREASRERRARLVQGKTALPKAVERSRTGDEHAPPSVAPTPAAVAAAQETKPQPATAPSAPQQSVSSASMLTGVAASRARRAALVQGKAALNQVQQQSVTNAPLEVSDTTSNIPLMAGSGRQVAQALRGARARNGRGDTQITRPTGRVRKAEPIQYPPKVAESQSYADKKVTGVRIGRGTNVTGDEPGAGLQVTGSQYIGKETGLTPREGGVKVGAARTAAGLVVTGTQVRSSIKITGDESNANIRITGEADQELTDDVLIRREQGAYTSMQFARQNNPHGHTVFGTNLGRSIKVIGSRDRDSTRATEQTNSGLPISGTAVGRSLLVTGDEAGSCYTITGDQYLLPASKQALCEASGNRAAARTGKAMGMNGRLDPVTGEKVVVSETWSRQRITGVDVEHNANVTGDEQGTCKPITGTPYHGPAQYESACNADAAVQAQQLHVASSGSRITGDTPLNVENVTGTQRGSARDITGTAYYCAEREDSMQGNAIEHLNSRFSVKSPQRQAHLSADKAAVEAPSAESRITGTFAAGRGKITGNQEFNFVPRVRPEQAARTGVTGEGRVQGTAITGSAWIETRTVTGTEGYIASERNPSARTGQPQAFAGSRTFKGKGRHDEPSKNVTGIVGWSEKPGSRITLSGGAKG